MQCKVCNSVNLSVIYIVDGLPLFQNKVYNSFEEAKQQKNTGVNVCQCRDCGFIFNALFENKYMNYDDNYQNEQSYSQVFIEHLDNIADYLIENGFKNKKIVEIGCGKGYFSNHLEKKGFKSIYGFDPAYEGNNPNITKDYFSEKYSSINADLIVLRHVLGHIEKPYEFLDHIKKATPKHAKILIEVSDFEWIVQNEAFWDIFYEHCNYFDTTFLNSFFKSAKTKKEFGGQYILTLASLHELKKPFSIKKYTQGIFDKSFKKIKYFLEKNKPLIIWGASSKGVTILNIFDKDIQSVDYCIDINPKKQNKFISITGHNIYSPQRLNVEMKEKKSILVVNQNYYKEIVQQYGSKNLQFYSIEHL